MQLPGCRFVSRLPRLRSRLCQCHLSFLAPLVPHSNPLLRHHPPLIPLSISLVRHARLALSPPSSPFHLGLRGTTGTTRHRTVRTTDTIPPELTAVYILWTDILPSAVLLIFDMPA